MGPLQPSSQWWGFPTFWSLRDACKRATIAEMAKGADSSQPQSVPDMEEEGCSELSVFCH